MRSFWHRDARGRFAAGGATGSPTSQINMIAEREQARRERRDNVMKKYITDSDVEKHGGRLDVIEARERNQESARERARIHGNNQRVDIFTRAKREPIRR